MAENTDQNLSAHIAPESGPKREYPLWIHFRGEGEGGLRDEILKLEATIVRQRRTMHRHDMWVSRRHEQLNSLAEMFLERVEDLK